MIYDNITGEHRKKFVDFPPVKQEIDAVYKIDCLHNRLGIRRGMRWKILLVHW
jgi:hypothetical protein